MRADLVLELFNASSYLLRIIPNVSGTVLLDTNQLETYLIRVNNSE